MDKKYKLTIQFTSGEKITMTIDKFYLEVLKDCCYGYRGYNFIDFEYTTVNVNMIEYFNYEEIKGND